jgi:hypothetical protein
VTTAVELGHEPGELFAEAGDLAGELPDGLSR